MTTSKSYGTIPKGTTVIEKAGSDCVNIAHLRNNPNAKPGEVYIDAKFDGFEFEGRELEARLIVRAEKQVRRETVKLGQSYNLQINYKNGEEPIPGMNNNRFIPWREIKEGPKKGEIEELSFFESGNATSTGYARTIAYLAQYFMSCDEFHELARPKGPHPPERFVSFVAAALKVYTQHSIEDPIVKLHWENQEYDHMRDKNDNFDNYAPIMAVTKRNAENPNIPMKLTTNALSRARKN
ncbi:hypothetical protein J4216_06630 [Candidatus Woesearchaeota archaeon]|nr:hypothetical protein [Candidatus Woesearchaeota archaeon]